MPLGATWMDQEILILSGQTQRQIYHLYVEFLKKGYNELIHKTEEEPWIQKTNLWLLGNKGGGGINWEIGIDINTLYIKHN